MSGWTDERVQILRTMQSNGSSCAVIASVLRGVTRNAVIGKLHRLGIHKVGQKLGGAAAVKDARVRALTRNDKLSELHFAKRGRSKREGPSSAARTKREIKVQELRQQFASVEIVDLPPDQSAVAVPFNKLNGHTCRWPLGDARDLDAMRFCGAEPHSKFSYCSRHAHMAYIPLPRRAMA